MPDPRHTDAFRAGSQALQSTPPDNPAPPATGRAPPDERLPRIFGRYELRRLLGRGGMGRVYLAYDPQLDRLVALKMPNPVAVEGWRERFLAEARTAATLTHPNVCPVFDVGEEAGQTYLTMAYIEGETLAAKLARERQLDPEAAVALVSAVARAMHDAHRRGIVHRDLKPANVMLDGDRPVITDFGLAVRATASDDLRLTLTGVALGTPAYMPPEQAGGEADAVGPAADVYAMGVMLYELVTGRVPFKAKSFGKLLAQIERDPPPPPSSINANVDSALEAIILSCLAKRPADRFGSAAELADALDRYLDGDDRKLVSEYSRPFVVPVATGEFVPAEAASTAAFPGRPRRARWAAALGALLLLVGAAGAVIYVQTEYGELEVKLSDPNAKVDVRVNGQEVALEADGRVTRIRAGKNQKLEVTGPDYETVSETFDLKRGGVTIVQVRLRPKGEVVQKQPDAKPKPSVVGPDPPVPVVGGKPNPPAVSPPPKPVPYPKEPTLVTAGGYEIFLDATKEQMETWLQEKEKKHSVLWLDSCDVADKPVFSAVAALDAHAAKWTALLDLPSAVVNDAAALFKQLPPGPHEILSVSGYARKGDVRAVLLTRPGPPVSTVVGVAHIGVVTTNITQLTREGYETRLLRPFLSGDRLRCAVSLTETETRRMPAGHGLTDDGLDMRLKKALTDGFRPTSVVAYTEQGQLRYAVAFRENTTKGVWEVERDLTAATLKTAAKGQAQKGFRPESVTAYSWNGAVRYCVVWVKEPPKPVPYPKEKTLVKAGDYETLLNATKEQMDEWLKEKKEKKHSVLWLDSVEVAGKPVYSAVAAFDGRQPDWTAFLDVPGVELNDINRLGKRLSAAVRNDKLYVLVAASGFSGGGDFLAAVLFHQKDSAGAVMGALPLQIIDANLKRHAPGLGTVVLRPFPSGERVLCAVCADAPPGKLPRHALELTAEQLAEHWAKERADGYRAQSVVAYPGADGLRYAVVSADNAANWEWSVDTLLTAAEFKAKAAEQAQKGFRPQSVTAYPWNGAVRYCVVWVKEPPPKKQPPKKP